MLTQLQNSPNHGIEVVELEVEIIEIKDIDAYQASPTRPPVFQAATQYCFSPAHQILTALRRAVI